MTETGTDVTESVRQAWARIEASLGRVLPASLAQLREPADPAAIDAVEADLAVALPEDFRASLLIHNGTRWRSSHLGQPSPVPLEGLRDTDGIVETTRMWRDGYAPEPLWDDPRVWAYQVDDGSLFLNGPVRPIAGSAGAVVVGDMNGDVLWLLDLDPPPGGTPGQVVRVDVECAQWDVLAPSWTQLLLRYAEDLERFATAPQTSTLEMDPECGPACEWGITPPGDLPVRPAWLRNIQARDPDVEEP